MCTECSLYTRPWACILSHFILWGEMHLPLIYRWENWGSQSICNMYKVTNLVGGKPEVWVGQCPTLLRHQSHHCSVWFGTKVDSGFGLILTSHQNSLSFQYLTDSAAWFCSRTWIWTMNWSLQNAFMHLENIGLEANNALLFVSKL